MPARICVALPLVLALTLLACQRHPHGDGSLLHPADDPASPNAVRPVITPPAKETSEPTEETSEPAEETSEPAEEASEPTEETFELVEVPDAAITPLEDNCLPELFLTPSQVTLRVRSFDECIRATLPPERLREWERLQEQSRKEDRDSGRVSFPHTVPRSAFEGDYDYYHEALEGPVNHLWTVAYYGRKTAGIEKPYDVAVRAHIHPDTPAWMVWRITFRTGWDGLWPIFLARSGAQIGRLEAMSAPHDVQNPNLQTRLDLEGNLGPACVELRARIDPRGRIILLATTHIEGYWQHLYDGDDYDGPREHILSLDGATCPLEPEQLSELLEALPSGLRFCQNSRLVPAPEMRFEELIPFALALQRATQRPSAITVPPEPEHLLRCQRASVEEPAALTAILAHFEGVRELILSHARAKGAPSEK